MNLNDIIDAATATVLARREDAPFTRGLNDCFALAKVYDVLLRGHTRYISDYDYQCRSVFALFREFARRGDTVLTIFTKSDYVPMNGKRLKPGDVVWNPATVSVMLCKDDVIVGLEEKRPAVVLIPYNPFQAHSLQIFRPKELL